MALIASNALAQTAPSVPSVANAGAGPSAITQEPHHDPHRPRAATSTPDNSQPSDVLDRLWLVDPRLQLGQAEDDLLRFGLHGAYRVEYGSVPSVPLSNYGFDNYRPSLGQSHRLEHLLRFSPVFTYRKSLRVVSQFDLPYGMLVGQSTSRVANDPEPLDERQPMQARGRYLYADFAFSNGHLTVGQQPSQWGLGLVDDSGDRPQFIGVPHLGTVVERVGLKARPLGKSHPWTILVATDLVFSDERISLTRGDRALRAVLGNTYAPSQNLQLAFLVMGERVTPHFDAPAVSSLSLKETTLTFDVTGHAIKAISGTRAKAFVAGEIAYVAGSTDLASEVLAPSDVRVQRWGALLRAGVIQTKGSGPNETGPFGISLEWGYASGDSNPGDGVDRRFTMNPSRRVGLLLFEEVLRWKTARSSVALEDPRLAARPSGTEWAVPTAGGVSNATYLSTQLLYRPLATLDVRGNLMVAQASADLTDPAQIAMTGKYLNYDGGNSRHRDLGVELDAAVEYRHPLENGLQACLGAEAGVLFPGTAFANQNERTQPRTGMLRGRFGFYF